MAKNNLGQWAEHEAVKILRQSGYTIVKLNYFSRFGEIDIIAETQQELVFIEVKARTSSYRGYAFEAVNLIKQQKMIKTAFRFLQEYPQYEQYYCRFDVIGFDLHHKIAKNVQQDLSKISYDQSWIENAFTLDADLINL
ncbi:YraN family protein [Acinetobacter bereziniae]|jgi:putative endonuclease|uniref:YraN family protein n=1 Tax=Acinetobacter bereziniae TaxID=106648 RepID=UPI00073F969D|nr:YraN family protein [Acinetobacter bereziniae]MBI0395296.1 YraN family protein [Acinetobacter bereziniae]MBJ9901936.1 YraN family protein [Acinetobacter bereziniae]MCU4317981.1 YraN family protein [Acinetobacter bereziniae]MCU4597794.1 YraN family protein [Acinetobacter bereziniae]MDA3440764.1 YraN family protein [Acinetobacter bereziniae]